MLSERAPGDAPPIVVVVVILVGGAAALFGTYWDESWHTDIGRDSLFSAPHVVLYVGTALVLAGVAWWGRVLLAVRPWGDLLRDGPIRLALAGAVAAAASAPIDAAWHAAFGRDAVLWSPPHMLGVVGFIAVACGLMAALRDARMAGRRLIVVIAASLLLAVALVPVIEYEGDAPQFAEVWYLPVVMSGIVLAFVIAERTEPWRWIATAAAALYTAVRVAFSGSLLALDHSAQLVPPVIVAGLAFDLTRNRRPATRALALTAAVTVSYVPALNFVYRGVRIGLADLMIGVALMAIVAVVVLAAGHPAQVRRIPAGAAALALPWLLVLSGPALAHDPGQGEVVVPVTVDATATDTHVEVSAVVMDAHCEDLDAVRTVARRAGTTVTGPLEQARPCVLEGEVELPGPARWFVYIEVVYHGELLEAWLPVIRPDPGHSPTSASKDDWLYVPAGSDGFSWGQWTAGIAIYLVILVLLAESVFVSRRSERALTAD